MAGTKKTVRVVELTLWLGAAQKVRIRANDHLNDDRKKPSCRRAGSPSTLAGADLIQLVDEILTKLRAAYPNKEPIELCVDGDSIVACQDHAT